MASLHIANALRSRLKNPKLLEGFTPRHASATFSVEDPSGTLGSQEPIAHVPDVRDIDEIIGNAHEAFKSYSKTLASQRSKMLRSLAQAQRSNCEDLAVILSCESGKPIKEARGEIEYGASYLEWFGEEAKRAYGSTIPGNVANRQIIVSREPVGVCSFITPFNFPNAMLARKLAAALGAGCTVVARPSEDVPLSAIALCNLAKDILPKDVFSVVTCSKVNIDHVGTVLSTDPRISKFSFTGSTNVGKKLLSQCASTIKRTSMELGGNASFIVFDCADINAALDGLMLSKFRNAGQTCVCSNRIFVQRDVYGEFLKKLLLKVKALKVGRALDEQTDIGSLIHDRAVSKVEDMVNEALQTNGAELLIGGKRELSLSKIFYQPTILANVQDRCQVFQNEIFGPVAAVSPFETEEEVIARANSTRVGLSSYLYAGNVSRIMRVSRALETGMLGINTGAISTEVAPFGGIKESGFGREGSHYGLDDYTYLKYMAWQY